MVLLLGSNMKKIILALLLLILISAKPAEAHLAGQPPYFKMNGVYSALYPVPTTSLEDFQLPQDLAPGNYLINEKIDFEIDKTQIPVLPAVIDKTIFMWDFGDGTKMEGLKNSYTYKKPGSYILKIMAKYQTDEPQLLQSVLINILPNSQYQLPKAVIDVDGFVTKDPLTDYLERKLDKEVNFDSSKSVSSSKIISVQWDFGDTETSSDPKIAHKYTKKYGQFFPVLRIKTEDGFMADSFMEIIQGDEPSGSHLSSSSGSKPGFNPKYAVPIGVLVVGLVIMLLIIVRSRKKSR